MISLLCIGINISFNLDKFIYCAHVNRSVHAIVKQVTINIVLYKV